MTKKEFAARLLKSRFQSPQDVRRVFEIPNTRAATRRRPHVVDRQLKGVVNGQFVRVKVSGRDPPSKLKKLYSPTHPTVKPFAQPEMAVTEAPTIQEFAQATRAERKEFFEEYWERLREWIKLNKGVLVLNFGSICSLISFTRSDILELRALSVTGSVSFILYCLTLPGPRDWTPIFWTSTFIAVNGKKIYDIFVERKGSVKLTAGQETTYKNYFEQHGVTRKQFEYIIQKSRTIQLRKGEVLIREGDPMNNVYLVTSGKTRAHHLGRRLTAVSYTTEPKMQLKGGASGAWVGEMAFFEQDWQKHDGDGESSKTPKESNQETGKTTAARQKRERAMYSIVALEDDTTVLAWSHKDMKALLERSPDMRSVLTQAMTAAIVSKVVGFTDSKKAASASSLIWLGSLWPWTRRSAVDGTGDVERIVETAEPPKVEVKEKPVYDLPDAKNLAT
uniref:Cyclic nucleotide-binding domain-containing protein n=1 Tax=Amphora coffeiformis TaxID=265554 RepID=A0A7S3L5H0_9STRA